MKQTNLTFMDRYRLILITTLGILAVDGVAAVILGRSIWAVDAIFAASAITGIYLLRKPLNLSPFLFSLLGLLAVIHCTAVFGLFKMTFFGHEYDSYVHTYSSIVIGAVSVSYLWKFKVPLAEKIVLALLLTLGVGLLNELIEFAGYQLFGEGEGLFLLGPGDIGATNAFENLMTDFFHDFYGNLVGVSLATAYFVRSNFSEKRGGQVAFTKPATRR